MTTVSIPGFILASPAQNWHMPHEIHGGMCLSFFSFKPTEESDHKVVCPHTLTFDLPEGWDPRATQIDALKAKQKELDSQYAVAIALIKQQINQLLCIEHEAAT